MNQHGLFLVGRWLIAAMFIMSAIGKAANWKPTVDLMQLHYLPLPRAALFTSVIAEFTGAIFLFIARCLYPTVGVLFAFVVLATVAIPLLDVIAVQNKPIVVRLEGYDCRLIPVTLRWAPGQGH
jgi:uncharacterized membrane protein YphA (DoxX/SURF4 family)